MREPHYKSDGATAAPVAILLKSKKNLVVVPACPNAQKAVKKLYLEHKGVFIFRIYF